MLVQELSGLLRLVKRLDDRVLYEIATCPIEEARDYTDRAIISVAAGEREWRLECQN